MVSKELLALARSVLEKSRPEKRDSPRDSRARSPEMVSQTTTSLGTSKKTVHQGKSPTVPTSHDIGGGTAGHPYSIPLSALRCECPQYVQFERWHLAINDAEVFLNVWADKAASLGWSVQDLFGLATVPDRPGPNYQRLSRYDQTGLVWLLHGRRVVELTKDKAVIETATGTVSYRRHNKPALGPPGDSLDDMGQDT